MNYQQVKEKRFPLPSHWDNSNTPTTYSISTAEVNKVRGYGASVRMELSCVAGGSVKWYKYIGKQFGSFQQNHALTYIYGAHVTPFLGIYQRQMITCPHRHKKWFSQLYS